MPGLSYNSMLLIKLVHPLNDQLLLLQRPRIRRGKKGTPYLRTFRTPPACCTSLSGCCPTYICRHLLYFHSPVNAFTSYLLFPFSYISFFEGFLREATPTPSLPSPFPSPLLVPGLWFSKCYDVLVRVSSLALVAPLASPLSHIFRPHLYPNFVGSKP